jgi:pyridoxal phosphate enzyme (YggS family)
LDLSGREMHLIGHLQSNKAAKAVECADMIQSVDSVRIAREISKECVKQSRQMPVLLEVNIGRDPAKFGFLPEDTEAALAEIAEIPGILIRGLMTVPPFLDDESQTRKFFSEMYRLFIDIRGKKMDNIDILSMGMSGDFELAIAEGSNLVRVGSAIFGERSYR